jgi:outer membrane protein TolC
MSSLSIDDQRRLLDACAQMAQERAQIASVLAELPTSWRNVRAALNELQRLVTRWPGHGL